MYVFTGIFISSFWSLILEGGLWIFVVVVVVFEMVESPWIKSALKITVVFLH